MVERLWGINAKLRFAVAEACKESKNAWAGVPEKPECQEHSIARNVCGENM